MITRINSKAFLSKKMREAIGDGASINFDLDPVKNGSAICRIIVGSNIDKKKIEKLIGEETNLTLRILSVEELREEVEPKIALQEIDSDNGFENQEMQEEDEPEENPEENAEENQNSGLPDWFGIKADNATDEEYDITMSGSPLETFFTQEFEPYKGRRNTQDKGIIEKIAATTPPDIDDVPFSFKNEDEVEEEIGEFEEVNEDIKSLKNPEFKRFVSDLNSFYDALSKNKNKQSSIDLSQYEGNPRQYAVMEEQKRLEESIDVPAYVVNEKCGSLMINDLDITLSINSPIDLAKFPVKKLISSNDLKQVLKSNMIRFVSPVEANKILMKKLEQEGNEFTQDEIIDRNADEDDETESSPKSKPISKVRSVTSLRDRDVSEILDLVGDSGKGERASIIDLEDNINGPTEEEGLVSLSGIGKPMPSVSKQSSHSGAKTTSHGNVRPNVSKSPTNTTKSPVAQIRKLSPVYKK